MMDAIESVKAELIKAGRRDTCMVKGCSLGDAEAVELLPLDPIDHDSTWLALCPEHQPWAAERNELAESIADKLREERKQLGKEHYDAVKRLASPDQTESDAVLMGEYDTLEEARRAEE